MQEAARRGLPARADVKAQVAIAQQSVVLHALIEDFVKAHQPTDAEITARYNKLVQDAGGTNTICITSSWTTSSRRRT